MEKTSSGLQEIHLQSALDTSPLMVSIFRIYDHRTLRWDYISQAWQAYFGYTSRQLLADPLLRFAAVHPQDRDRVVCQYLEQVFSEGSFSCEYRHYSPDSHQLRWVSSHLTSNYDPDQACWVVVALETDSTEHKHQDSYLRLHTAALTSVTSGVVITDRWGRIEWVNPAFTQLTGYSLEESVGQSAAMLKSEHQDDDFFRNLWQIILQGQVWQGEIINRRKDGTLYTEHMTITPVSDAKGEITHFVAVKQDITAHKQAEEIKAQNQVLARVNHLKDEFLSTVSHELRSPLANIKVAIRVLETLAHNCRSGCEQECQGLSYLDLLKQECDRELELINDLLDLQRLESTDTPLQLKAIDLNAHVAGLASFFQDHCRDKQIAMQLDLASSPLDLYTDPVLLERVIRELLHNACKYTPAGERIKIRTQAAPAAAEVMICNTGVHLSAQELTRLFDRFYRVTRLDCRREGGTGLGLAIVKQLTEQLEGTISARGGTDQVCFTLWLPRQFPSGTE